MTFTYSTSSASETRDLALSFAKTLKENQVICLFGDLGAGKTTFVKGLQLAFDEEVKNQVSSPTFSYLNIYPGKITVYHFDLYRLRDADEFLAMGFDEYFFMNGICCIEWSERISCLLPNDAIRLTLVHAGNDMRHITIENHDKKISF